MAKVCLITLLAWLPHAACAAALQVVERAATDTVAVHAGRAADNTGDVLTFSNEIFDAQNRTKLGTDQGYCVRMVAGKSWECHFTVLLAGGQLSVDGPFLDAADSVMAVTGGTGSYAGVRGEMTLHARDRKGSAYDFGFDLK